MTSTISKAAEDLRVAIEKAQAAESDIAWLPRFPAKCCNFAANLLLLDLHEMGVGGLRRMMGTVLDEKGDDLAAHVWVLAGGTLIDITADQFGQPKIIVQEQSDWHDSLDDVKPFLPRQDVEEGIASDNLTRLRALYEQTLTALAPFRSGS